MAKTRKSQTSTPKPKTLKKITKTTKSKHLVNKDAKAVQPIRSSARLKRLKFSDMSLDLQSKIGWEILNNFTLSQQLKMRRISLAWDYNVQLACKQVRSLVLRLDKRGICYRWNYENYFNANSDVKLAKIAEFKIKEIKESLRKKSTVDSLGKLFCNIERLTIYYSVDGCRHEFLLKLLKSFPKVTSFSICIFPEFTHYEDNRSAPLASKLFATIADYLAPLNSLHFYFNSVSIPKVDLIHLCTTFSYLQNLSLCSSIANYHEILEILGKNLPPHLSVQSLSLRAPELKVSKIVTTFERNPALAKLRRLQLVQVVDREVVDLLLSHFTELEYLQLWSGQRLSCGKIKISEKNNYSIKWMKTFAKLPNLTELVLIGMHPIAFDFNRISLPKIRRLSFYSVHFYENIKKNWKWSNRAELAHMRSTTTKKQRIKLITKHFTNSLAKQYPNLEVLTILTNHECDCAIGYDKFKDDLKSDSLSQFRCLKNVNFENLTLK